MNWVNLAEISRHSVDSWLLLVAYAKKKEREKLKEGLLNKDESIIDGLESSQTPQMAKDAKIRKQFQSKDKIYGTSRKKTV